MIRIKDSCEMLEIKDSYLVTENKAFDEACSETFLLLYFCLQKITVAVFFFLISICGGVLRSNKKPMMKLFPSIVNS